MSPAEVETLFGQVLAEVSGLMADAYRHAGAVGKEHPLAQPGLREGTDIVRDYLAHGEAGMALDHLLYMLQEPPLTLSAAGLERLALLRRHLGA